MNQIKEGVYVLIALACLVSLSFVAGYTYSSYRSAPLFADLQEQNTSLISTATVDQTSYSEVVKKLRKENKGLLRIIKDYESKPEKIKYITRVETIAKGSETVVVEVRDGVAPESYTFKLENGLPVARFDSSEEEYSYVTYNLELETDIVVGEETATVLVTAYSSAISGKGYQLPSRISIKGLEKKEHKLIEPQFYVGITQSLSQTLDYDLYASLGFPFIHLNENVDVTTPRFSVNSQSSKLGVDLVSWNAATKIPLLSDIWIAPGVSRHLNNKLYSADFTVGSRF
jgi:hypothetical protein